MLAAGKTVLAVVGVKTLREPVSGAGAGRRQFSVSDAAYEDVLSHLKETTFTSRNTEDMLYASRAIEGRARRCGTGTVHAGFQRCSTIVSQQAIYEDLSGNGVSVHAYGVPDVTPPEGAGGQVHAVGGEIADLWFVVYDGGGEETQKSALLAEEDSVGTFYGFWTYDRQSSTASASTSLRRISGLAGNSHGLEREQLTANVSERNRRQI